LLLLLLLAVRLFSGTLGVLRPSSAATQQKQDAERREREGVDFRGVSVGRNQMIFGACCCCCCWPCECW
jgi:hypothetical protein